MENVQKLENENEQLKLENEFLKEKIINLEREIKQNEIKEKEIIEKEIKKIKEMEIIQNTQQQKNEMKDKERNLPKENNKREKFIDFNELILQNKEYKALNDQLTIACEDIKKENEIIIEDFRKLQIIYEQIQQKYNGAMEENARLKNEFYLTKNQFNHKTAAQKPLTFFESPLNNNKSSTEQNWSDNHFKIKKNEIANEFVKSKLISYNQPENIKTNDLRLSNYKENGNLSFSLIKNSIKDVTYNFNDSTSNKPKIIQKDPINYSKKEADQEILFPFKKTSDYFEKKTNNKIKGKLIEQKKEFIDQFAQIKNLNDFKLNCLKEKSIIFSNEMVELSAEKNVFIEENFEMRFNLSVSNFSKSFIDDLDINIFHDPKSKTNYISFVFSIRLKIGFDYYLTPKFVTKNLKPNGFIVQDLKIILKNSSFNFMVLKLQFTYCSY